MYSSRRRLARSARFALSGSIAVSALALLVFHVALFWNQIGDGRLLDPAVAVRWGIGALLLGTLVGLRRAGVSVIRGRRALVVWVLVALLHWTASPATGLVDTTGTATQPAQVIVDLPNAGAVALLIAATLLLLSLRVTRIAPPALRSMRVRWFAAAGARTPILRLHLASRAPPLFA